MSSASIGFAKTTSRPEKTAAAGTAITSLVPPAGGLKTKVTLFKYTPVTTAQSLAFMRVLGATKLSAAAAAAATTVVLARDPGAYAANATADGQPVPSVANNLIASGDYLAIQKPDGTYYLVVAGTCTVNADGTVTVASMTVPTGGLVAGAIVYWFGVAADTDPRTNEAHPAWNSGTAAITYGDGSYTVVESNRVAEPVLFYSPNATNAGTLNLISVTYGP